MSISSKEANQIASCPLLHGISMENAERIFSRYACEVESYSPGDVVMSPADQTKRIGFLLQGKAEIITSGQSKNTLLRFLNEGEAFGASRLFSDAPFVSVVTAKSTCKIFFLSEDAILALMESDTLFLRRYLTFLSGRIRYLNQKISYLSAGSAERKLALYLSYSQESVFTLALSISALSELLDIGRASLYRAFDKLIEDGYITKCGREIRILQKEALLQAYQ